jgi:16S rRNA (guanine527-N7)-methyltransferase
VSDKDLRSRIRRRLEYAGAPVGHSQVQQLGVYFALLAKWNKQLSLTSLQLDPPTDDAVDRLLIEPVAAARTISSADDFLVDLGSGGGSPAIPLRIAAPHLRLMMVESNGKKSAFLRDAVRQLGLENCRVANCRFEELHQREDLEPADLVSVRAVKPEPQLVEQVRRLLRAGGRTLWFTSTSAAESVGDAIGDRLSLESAQLLIPATVAQLLIFKKDQ